MQLLTATCPYCKTDVDSTIDHVGNPIVCPTCNKPFELEVRSATVDSIREVDRSDIDQDVMGIEPKERTLLEVHPAIFRARPLTSLALLLLLVLAVSSLIASSAGSLAWGTTLWGPLSVAAWFSLFILLVLVGFVAYWTLISRMTKLTITDERTIHRYGLISRDTSEVQHDDVRNMQLDQTFLQRLLNIGTIAISSSGQDDLEVVARRIPNPGGVLETIREHQS